MHIALHVTNAHQAELLSTLLSSWYHENAKPVVAGNTEQSAPLSLSNGGEQTESKTSEAPSVSNTDTASDAPVKQKRAKKEKEVESPVAPEPAKESGAKTPTIDDVRAALQGFTERHDMAKGIAKLKEFGAQRISELAEGSYVNFIAECTNE